MSKKNDIRLSKRESHQVPDSEIRGYFNKLKKDEKINESRSLQMLNAKISIVGKLMGDMTLGTIIGFIGILIFPSLNTFSYGVGIFLSMTLFSLFRLSYEKVSRDDYEKEK